MGLRPTRASENLRRRPRAGGGPRKVDSRFRGNDLHGLTFRSAERSIDRFQLFDSSTSRLLNFSTSRLLNSSTLWRST